MDMWDPDAGDFMVGDQILWLEIEDIYFLIGLLRRRETMCWLGDDESQLS